MITNLLIYYTGAIQGKKHCWLPIKCKKNLQNNNVAFPVFCVERPHVSQFWSLQKLSINKFFHSSEKTIGKFQCSEFVKCSFRQFFEPDDWVWFWGSDLNRSSIKKNVGNPYWSNWNLQPTKLGKKRVVLQYFKTQLWKKKKKKKKKQKSDLKENKQTSWRVKSALRI